MTTKRQVLYELDKVRLLDTEEIGNIKQQRYSSGILVLDFMDGRGGSSVTFRQRRRLNTLVEIEVDGHRITRFLQETFFDESIATLHFHHIYTEKPDSWSCTIITIGDALAREQLIGESAQRASWDILWWCLNKRWDTIGRFIAQAFPKWWEGITQTYPEFTKFKVSA